VIAALLIPVIAFVPMAFSASTFLSLPPQGLSLRWFEQSPRPSLWLGAMIRSSASVSDGRDHTRCRSLAALGVARTRGQLGGAAFLLFLAPMMIPSIVIAIACSSFRAAVLVATDLGIIIGHTVIAMPIVFVILLATFKGTTGALTRPRRRSGPGRAQVLRL